MAGFLVLMGTVGAYETSCINFDAALLRSFASIVLLAVGAVLVRREYV
jgi:hypothetical protein